MVVPVAISRMWIDDDPIIHPSRWLVVTRQRGFPHDFWKYVDRWCYLPSKSLACGDSPRGCSPRLNKMVDRWSCYRYKAVPCRNSPRISHWLMPDRWSCYRYESATCRNSPRRGSPRIVPSVSGSARSHAHDSGVRILLKRECLSRGSSYDLWVQFLL